MIPAIPLLVVVGSVMLGLLLYTGYSMMDVQELHDRSDTNTQERLQERMFGEYEGSPTSIDQAKIFSEWTDDSRIVGIMVTCDDGSVHTMETDEVINGGEGYELTPTMMTQLETLAGRCP